jgi:hypothetical protein
MPEMLHGDAAYGGDLGVVSPCDCSGVSICHGVLFWTICLSAHEFVSSPARPANGP